MRGITLLTLGLALFLLPHLIAGIYEARQFFVRLLGTTGHRIAHSVLALTALVMIVIGFGGRDFIVLYAPPTWGYWVPILTMPFALTLLAGAHGAPGVKLIVRHPMLAGIALFAFAHLFANGDLASVLLFGTFLIYSVIAMPLTDRKMRLGSPERWEELKRETSLIPFVALAQGRVPVNAWETGLWRSVVIGFVVYGLLVYFHGTLFGMRVPVIG